MRRKLETIAFILYTLLIFLLSSVPGKNIPSSVSPYSLLLHFTLYFFYGLVIFLFFRNLFFSSIFGILYGLSDEIHQYFVPGRSCDPVDFLVDSIAVLVSMAIVCGWKRLSIVKH